MTNNKALNPIKVVVVLLLLCGMMTKPWAAEGDDTGGVNLGFTVGAQTFEDAISVCDKHIQQTLGGGTHTCQYRALAGGPYLRIGSQSHSMMLAYRLSADYERTFRYTLTRQVRTVPFSFSSYSIAYQYRDHLAGPFEAFFKIGRHNTKIETDDSIAGVSTGEGAGFLWGIGLVLNEGLILGYEHSAINGDIGNGRAIYLAWEPSLFE